MSRRHLIVIMAAVLLCGLAAPAAQACDPGCTLTQGYWRTHPDAWVDLDPGGYWQGDDGPTAMDVLWTPPRVSAWYQLVHQFITTLLNISAGFVTEADFPEEVRDAAEYSWILVGIGADGVDGSKDLKQLARMYAEILDDFNSGLIGPGHCDG